jgi:nucleoid-associated protein YgaU
MHNRWPLVVAMVLALGAFGGENNSADEQSAAAAAVSTTTTIQPPTLTEPTPATSTTNPLGERKPEEPGSPSGEITLVVGQEQVYQVVLGDNLWTIAREHLTEARGGADQPTTREVAAYWLRVIEANRDRLVSGDPDLIYPGERIVLAPVD